MRRACRPRPGAPHSRPGISVYFHSPAYAIVSMRRAGVFMYE
ncbi:hypothetical protein BSIN_1788 [Burkholderia singularis]|uniref:Uncharacterized protein n=1 Tax=Burkholderia singularis TaxID=1503053 RepID=A0A238GZX3_9BURK|nr:hypothetical protein BSIN_1788 [Burkholderia singularis]